MKIRMHVCDLCKKREPDAKIKYKYRAKRFWWLWYEGGWERIELCQKCLEKIIEANTESEEEQYSRDCKTCIHSDDGKCAYTEECHECMWESQYEANEESEEKS